MFAYGLSGPPRLAEGERIFHPSSTAATAWPARPNGIPWTYIIVSTESVSVGGALKFGDATIQAQTTPCFFFTVGSGPIIVNVMGTSHYDVKVSGSGSDDMLITPIDAPRGNGNMLKSPPQLGATITEDSTSLGDALIPQTGTYPTKYVMITSDAIAVTELCVGQAGITAANDGQVFINSNSGPLILNVTGMDTIAWSATTSGELSITALTA